ncbi:MAG: tRNA guanosine(34) transglycosylase Tgt [Acetobacterales bacterium]
MTAGTDYPGFSFDILNSDAGTRARRGRLCTPHGTVETPAFVFCATRAALRPLTPAQARAADTQIILGNTYHLMLAPGADTIAAHGGLHRYMGWDGPMLTDSGGFQIFSMGHGGVADEIKGRRGGEFAPSLLKIEEEGATFRSYLDGAVHKLTPELAVDVQRRLGADIVLVLDECTPYHVDRDYTARSMALTHRWAERSLLEYRRGDGIGSGGPQALYGITQGGVYPDLRRESAEAIAAMPFFGLAVGGCLGGDKEEMHAVFRLAMDPLAGDPRPVHLLGIGGIDDIWQGVALGIDTFDCVHPTRIARHGGALVRPGSEDGAGRGRINLRNACWRDDRRPLDPEDPESTGAAVSRAYLHHLVGAGEPLAMHLLATHNVRFMNRLMREVRAAVEAGRVREAAREWGVTVG